MVERKTVGLWYGNFLFGLGKSREKVWNFFAPDVWEPWFNEPASFGIPGFIFQAKDTKFGTNVGLNMLITVSSKFY